MPENPNEPGKPVAVCCPDCKIKWCSQCPNAFHPHATSCGEVIDIKCQWDVIATGMIASAQSILVEANKDVELSRSAVPEAKQKLRNLLLDRVRKRNQEIRDVDGAIAAVHRRNHAELTWAGDGGVPRVIGSRRCYHCGRQPATCSLPGSRNGNLETFCNNNNNNNSRTFARNP